MVQMPFTGSDCVSFVWGVYMLGQLVVSGIVGPMADAGYVRAMFYICIPLAAQVLVDQHALFLIYILVCVCVCVACIMRGVMCDMAGSHPHWAEFPGRVQASPYAAAGPDRQAARAQVYFCSHCGNGGGGPWPGRCVHLRLGAGGADLCRCLLGRAVLRRILRAATPTCQVQLLHVPGLGSVHPD